MDFFYSCPTWPLILGLLAAMLAANEIGFRFGRRFHQGEPESSRAVSNGIKASIFGLVALLLGFSFSFTVNRFDQRRKVVLDEANSIGTCYLRAGILSEKFRQPIRKTLSQLVDLRLEHFDQGLDPVQFKRTTQEMENRLSDLWMVVEAAGKVEPEAVRTSQIVPATNEVIDLGTTRAWVTRSHLPAPVSTLLFVCVVVSCSLVGHSSGQVSHRHRAQWTALNILLALLVFIILDYDRPRQGMIRVDHVPFIELKASFAKDLSRT